MTGILASPTVSPLPSPAASSLGGAPVRDPIPAYRRITVLVLALLSAGIVTGIAVPAGLGWDFANFYDAGRRAAAGQFDQIYNPSSPIAGEQPQGTMRFWGTPVSAVFYAPLSLFRPRLASTLFKVQNTLAYLTALAILFWYYRRFAGSTSEEQWRFTATFAVLCLLYQPFWTVYRVGGQSTPTVFLFLTLALLTHIQGRHTLTAVLLVLAVAIKPAFGLIVLFLILTSGGLFLSRVLVVSTAAGVLAIALLGWPVHREFLDLLRQGAGGSPSWVYSSSLYVPFEGVRLLPGFAGDSQGAHLALTVPVLALKAIVVGTCAYLTWRSWSQPWSVSARRHFSFLMAIVFCLLVSQVVWEHYLSLLFLLLGYVWAARQRFSRTAVALMAGIAAVAIGQNLVLSLFLRDHVSLGSAPAAFLIGLWKSAPLLLTLVFLARHSGEWWRSYAAPAWAA